MGKPFSEGPSPRITPQELQQAEDWLHNHFVFIKPEEADCTVTGILRICDAVNEVCKVDGIVIDPWNELEHRRPANFSDTEYISQSLSILRKHVRNNDQHLWLVAHPTKLVKDKQTLKYPVPTLYDISGSAHFHNKCDFGLSVWRDVLDNSKPSEAHVQKVRFKETGRVGKAELYFNKKCNRFSDSPVCFKLSHELPGGRRNDFDGIFD